MHKFKISVTALFKSSFFVDALGKPHVGKAIILFGAEICRIMLYLTIIPPNISKITHKSC